MNRHEYKGYWIEIFLECKGELEDELCFYCASIEYPNEGGGGEVGEEYVTLTEAKLGAEKYIDMLEAFPESEINFVVNEP